MSRAIKVLTAALLLRTGFWMHLELNMVENLPGLLCALLLYVLSFVLIVEAFTDLDLTRVTRSLTVVVIALFAAAFVFSAPNAPRYCTDAMLFTRYAVELLLEGHNPYAYSMQQALLKYATMDYRWLTETLEGAPVSTYSYPSLSFLIYVPAFLAGLRDVGAVMAAFFCLTAFFLVKETPQEYRLLPILILFLDPMLAVLSYVGAHDVVWMFFLLLAMKYFNPRSKDSLRVSAILLGVAFAVKQTPWLILPFLVIWTVKEAGVKRAAELISIAALVFLAPNLPFMLWDFNSWLEGVLTPVAKPLIPQGYGLVALVYEGYVYLPKEFFTVATVTVAATLLALYWLNFNDKVKYLAWVVPMFVLFFAWRSLPSYFMFFIPVAYYAALLMVKEHGLLKA
ncbi:MAG: hypothetical protein DRJ97_01790 [Thermoprotei archaeon]|nr:MAG: hypothetical protein DRJ97_01790 [Thermoprotei archaeon]